MLNVILFLSSYAGGFLFALTRNATWAFMLYEVVYFMYPEKRWWGPMVPSLSYSFFVVLLMMGVFAKDFTRFNKNKLLSAPQMRWVYLFSIIYMITGTYAVMPAIHSQATEYFLKLIIIISIAYKLIDSEKDLQGMLFGYIFGAWYLGFVAYQTGRNSGDRVEGIGTVDAPDSNGVAAAIAPALVLALYYYWVSTDKRIKAGAAIGGVFIANAIVLINSRGTFLAVLVGLCYFMGYLVFSKHQRPGQRKSVAMLIVLGLSGALFLLDDGAIERFRSLENTEMNEEEETSASRVFFWLAAIEVSKDYPFGLGFKGFNAVAPDYIPPDIDTGGKRNRSVHSTWFQALTEVGYHGLFAFFMMLFACMRTMKKTRVQLALRDDFDNYFKIVAIEGALVAYVVAMTFINRLTAEVLFWLVLYTACAYNVHVVRYTGEQPQK